SSSEERIVLVGKGITYDTGGLSLKPSASMDTMKCDMAGAAATLGCLLAAAEMKMKVNLTVLIAATENSIGSKAYKLGDVYQGYSKKTVEIKNTDAEGRLALADCLAYAVDVIKPKIMIDLATLTGAALVALGDLRSPLFSTHEGLALDLYSSGEQVAERLWQMPLDPEYKEMLSSKIADIKNCGSREGSLILVRSRGLGDVYKRQVSGKAIKKLIDSYGCSINGKKQLFSSYKVQAGDFIEVSLSHLESNTHSSVVVLHETSNYLICSKGINTPSDEILFRKLLKREDLFLVHRLDKDTTGLIVVAKNNSSKIYFEELFKKREIKKIYHAISQGNAKEADFKVENYLGKIASYQGQSIWGRVSKESGLFASTYFRVLKKVNKTALLECQPTTGRTHQIRVHLSESSLPIVGDYHYAKELRFFYASKRPL
ncbi:MAG: hypothetical protein EBZ47_09600, partial [Chlamydiae bacterium]|nr:hypothetical protein [Chlamydiota bacterium]